MSTILHDFSEMIGPVGRAGGGESLQEFRHDLRQPLAAVELLVDAALSTKGAPPDLVGMLGRIQKQTDWIAELLRSTEPDQQEITVIDLAVAVEGPCLATPVDVPYDVSLVQAEEAPVLVDPVGLRRAAWNLIDNARRAVAGGGTVEVRVRRLEHDALLQVDDSGPGFGALPIQHGHGLAGVRRFVQRFDGDFSIATSRHGGAQVNLRLPLALGSHVDCGQ